MKVVEEQSVCYCSNFDIDVDDWFKEYENIELFKSYLEKNLGKHHMFLFYRHVMERILSSGGTKEISKGPCII